jgi:hypothetical protein
VDRVDGGDAGVEDGGGGLGLAQEAEAGGPVADDVVVEDLEGDLAVGDGVLGEVDAAHAAGAEQADDAIGAEGLACAVAHAGNLHPGGS